MPILIGNNYANDINQRDINYFPDNSTECAVGYVAGYKKS
jgi:hypothetical protein